MTTFLNEAWAENLWFEPSENALNFENIKEQPIG